MQPKNSTGNLIVGTIVYSVTIAAWLYAAQLGIESGPLFYIASPVIGALFLVGPLTKASDAAQQAATQTNGSMKATMKAAVSEALGDRDKARTRQQVGDISEVILPLVEGDKQ